MTATVAVIAEMQAMPQKGKQAWYVKEVRVETRRRGVKEAAT